jgi:hypothetical protein
MTKVFAALATSVDGYITGPNPGPDQPLGDGGAELVDGGGPHPTAPPFVLTRPPLPDLPITSSQTFVTTGITDLAEALPIPGFGGGRHPIGWSSKTRRPSAASTGWSRSTPSTMRMNQPPSGMPRA